MILLCLLGVMPVLSQDAADAFAASPVAKVDRSKDRKSPEYISDEVLKVLREPRLDNGTGKDDLNVIRLTVLRSFHAPLVFIWRITPDGNTLQVKRAKMKIVDEQRVYEGLDIDKSISLSKDQLKLIKAFWEKVEFHDLPQISEQEEMITASMDGSTWVYETAAAKESILFAKSNPLHFFPESELLPAARGRQKTEFHLNLFAVMLWTMAGIDDADVY